jgi:hypothetical protein
MGWCKKGNPHCVDPPLTIVKEAENMDEAVFEEKLRS